jgi:hypothetical protein
MMVLHEPQMRRQRVKEVVQNVEQKHVEEECPSFNLKLPSFPSKLRWLFSASLHGPSSDIACTTLRKLMVPLRRTPTREPL